MIHDCYDKDRIKEVYLNIDGFTDKEIGVYTVEKTLIAIYTQEINLTLEFIRHFRRQAAYRGGV